MIHSKEVSPGVHVSGQGPAIVLLHSSLASSRQWYPLVALLQDKFTLINFDLLGYGTAEKVVDTANYNFNDEVIRILAVLENLIPEQSFHLVGHSCGGALALKLAVEHPEKLLSLALYEPVAFHLTLAGSDERAEVESFSQTVRHHDNLKAAEIFTNYWNHEGFLKSLPEPVQAAMANDMTKVNLDFIGLISETYHLSDIKKITAPSLILSGVNSPYLGRYLADIIFTALPNATHKVFVAGHIAPISEAKKVQGFIAEFIRSLS